MVDKLEEVKEFLKNNIEYCENNQTFSHEQSSYQSGEKSAYRWTLKYIEKHIENQED